MSVIRLKSRKNYIKIIKNTLLSLISEFIHHNLYTHITAIETYDKKIHIKFLQKKTCKSPVKVKVKK